MVVKTALSVNLNKIALIRNARDTNIPDIVEAAKTCIDAGCHGITVHPRPDQRHIRVQDVYRLAEFLKDYPAIEFNIEGNPEAGAEANGYPGFLELVESVRPHQCTLVPDDPFQLTSDHGQGVRLIERAHGYTGWPDACITDEAKAHIRIEDQKVIVTVKVNVSKLNIEHSTVQVVCDGPIERTTETLVAKKDGA